MSIQKLFESVDKEVFTPELREMLQEAFDDAVENAAQAKAIVIADELYEAKISDLESQAEAYGEYVKAESQKQLDETLEKLSSYVDLVVDEFLQEAKDSLVESVKSEQADMLIEAFDSMLTATGLKMSDILESAKPDSSSHINESRVNKLAQEVIELKEQNEQLLKMGIIKELSEGLSLMQADKFHRLAELVKFEKSEDYIEKLETIKESISLEGNSDRTQKINENTKTDSIWSHLV